MMYKRYMVFDWSDYDNVGPFDCVYGSFDSIDKAKDFSSSLGDRYESNSCVFDRVEGKVIANYENEEKD